MPGDYLLKEYELNYAQLRYYDDRHTAALTYLFSLTSAVATAQFAVFKFLEGETSSIFYACQAFLAGVVFIATVLLYAAMLQNRIYFVFTARQLNAIRSHLMATAADGFANNQLYTSTSFPAFKLRSVHTFQLLGATLLSSLFAGVTVASVSLAESDSVAVWWAVAIALAVLVAEAGTGVIYLLRSSAKSADEAVHAS